MPDWTFDIYKFLIIILHTIPENTDISIQFIAYIGTSIHNVTKKANCCKEKPFGSYKITSTLNTNKDVNEHDYNNHIIFNIFTYWLEKSI